MSDLSSKIKHPYKRSRYLVDRALQLRFMLQLAGSGLLLVVMAGVSMFLWGRYLLEKELYSPHLSHAGSGELLLPLLLGLNLVFAALIVVVVVLLGRRHLRKITGSLLRLEDNLEQMGQGEVPAELVLRNDDPLQSVGETFNSFSSGVNQRRDLVRIEIRSAVTALQHALETGSSGTAVVSDLDNAKTALEKARKTLNYRQVGP